MNDILETVQHKIDKLVERLPSVMEWNPSPRVLIDNPVREDWSWSYSSWSIISDSNYRWGLLASLMAELMYWLDMQEMLLETV